MESLSRKPPRAAHAAIRPVTDAIATCDERVRSSMTHDDLVKRAVAWLKRPVVSGTWRKSGCGVAVPELVSYAPEIPDAIGWSSGWSYLVECKCSRSDFVADQNKGHRAYGAGTYRLFLCEPGVISPSELPSGW